jgi:uncharacterized protein (DUF305 family)
MITPTAAWKKLDWVPNFRYAFRNTPVRCRVLCSRYRLMARDEQQALHSPVLEIRHGQPVPRRAKHRMMQFVNLLRATSRAAIVVPLLLCSSPLFGQVPSAADGSSAIVQPGAPGERSKILTKENVVLAPRAPSGADISFMQGMIMHHSQAVDMTDLLRTRGRSKELQELGRRISISQSDEIKFMKRWLTDRNQANTMDMGDMKGMDHKGHNMDSMALMPGMLTPAQMKELAHSSGARFDHLFLTGMIQHHNGALVMVEDLFNTAGAGQDPALFDFATDIDNTQRAEIEIMRRMLEKEKK